jgi:hypothetical protein
MPITHNGKVEIQTALATSPVAARTHRRHPRRDVLSEVGPDAIGELLLEVLGVLEVRVEARLHDARLARDPDRRQRGQPLGSEQIHGRVEHLLSRLLTASAPLPGLVGHATDLARR